MFELVLQDHYSSVLHLVISFAGSRFFFELSAVDMTVKFTRFAPGSSTRAVSGDTLAVFLKDFVPASSGELKAIFTSQAGQYINYLTITGGNVAIEVMK